MQESLKKLISIVLIAVFVFINTATTITYAVEGMMSANELENQGTSTNNNNVEFDVYFEGGKHSNISAVEATDTKLTVKITVKDAGYLNNATVQFIDSNFSMINDNVQNDKVQLIDTSSDKIVFNKINSGETATITLPIKAKTADTVTANLFNKDIKSNLTGTYVNNSGKEINLTSSKTIHKEWNSDAKIELTQTLSKYIPYSLSSETGVMLQEKITSKLENNSLPIKTSTINVQVPTIKNEKPDKVIVIANSTNATNGDLFGANFNENNWTYDNARGTVTINVSNNPDNNGNISWVKNSTDEFLITYIYSETIYNSVKDQEIPVAESAMQTIEAYNNTDTKADASVSANSIQKVKLGDMIDFTTNTVDTLNKGYMYNNKNATEENKKETEYAVNYVVNIGYAKLTDKIQINQSADNFVAGNNEFATTVGSTNYAYDKSVSINKAAFNKILGDTGYINILNGNTTIATINKDTASNDETNYIVDIAQSNLNTLSIQTSKPQKEGRLNITINKAISKNVDYSLEQLKSFQEMKLNMNAYAVSGDKNFATANSDAQITLLETSAKSTININQENLSTIVTNENVEIKAILETNTIDDTMYKDPTIVITLPAYIDNLEIKSINMLYADELTITNSPVAIRNDDGTQTITINTKGTLTKYTVENMVQGPTILITANITLNKLTPSKQMQLNLAVTDTLGTTVGASGSVQYVAPTGVVTTNTIENYNENSEKLTAVSGQEKTAVLKTQSTAKVAKITQTVINNYENTIDTVRVLGRTFFKGNKDVSTNQDLASTMDVALSNGISESGIDANKVTIYYSENGDATEDLTNQTNAWTTTPASFEKVKSYLAVLNKDVVMNQGDSITLTYDVTIPENLSYNQSAYQTYMVYFNNNKPAETIKDTAVSTKLGMTTGAGPVVEMTLQSDKDATTPVMAGHYIKYTTTIKNTGSEDATNVVVSMDKPEKGITDAKYSTVFMNFTDEKAGKYDLDWSETKTNNVGTLKVGQTATVNFYLEIVSDDNQTDTIEPKVNVIGDKVNISKTVTNTIKKAVFNIKSTTDAADNIIYSGVENTYTTTISTLEENGENNVVAKIVIPDGLKYKSSKYLSTDGSEASDKINYDQNTKTLNVNIGNLTNTDSISIDVTIEPETLDNVDSKDFKLYTTVQSNDITEQSDPITLSTYKDTINVQYSASIPDGNVVANGDKLAYQLKVANKGKRISHVEITDALPTGVSYVGTDYTIGTEKKETYNVSDNTTKLDLYLNADETADVNINVLVSKSLAQDTNITNKPVIQYNDSSTYEVNSISHIAEANNISKIVSSGENNIGSGTDITNVTESGKRISGIVWIDKNNDGIRDDSEEKVSDVTVMLYDTKTGNIAKDNQANELKTTTTDGIYTFKNVPAGTYLVIFMYDSANYSSTQYKVASASEDKNSDATDTKVVLYGESKVAGVTGNITVGESNIYNIDLGIISNPKFDLKLSKEVSKITVKNSKGTVEHQYNKNFAKLDLAGKYIDDTTIVVEYKITVTNEGAVPGYAKKIVDYMPNGMKFNSELNPDWYVGDTTAAYNSSLANTVINPGESKDITLILTEKMSNDKLGLVNNTAEIYEASNNLGIADIDSTPANKASNEDDMSIANIILSLNTGKEVVIMTTLICTILIIVGIGTYFIKKKVLK